MVSAGSGGGGRYRRRCRDRRGVELTGDSLLAVRMISWKIRQKKLQCLCLSKLTSTWTRSKSAMHSCGTSTVSHFTPSSLRGAQLGAADGPNNDQLTTPFSSTCAEKLITPEAFARVFCDDLDIPQIWATEVAKQIAEQIEEQVGVAEIPLRPHQDEADFVERDLRCILNVSVPYQLSCTTSLPLARPPPILTAVRFPP